MKTDLERDYTSTCVEILSAPRSKFLSSASRVPLLPDMPHRCQKKKCYTAHTHRKYVRMATSTTQACNNSELSKGISPTLCNFKLKNSSHFSIQNSNTHHELTYFFSKQRKQNWENKQTNKVRVQQRCNSTPKVKYQIKRFTMRRCKRFN
jgi:hypothetical protein